MTDYYVDEDYEDGFDDEDDYDYYSGQELDEGIEDLRPTEIEGRTSWIYLGLLSGIFVLLVGFSWACNDTTPPPGEQLAEQSDDAVATSPVVIEIAVDGDIATVTGEVPDDAARQQILLAAQNLYGPENVIDRLVIDEGRSFDDGSVLLSGSALFEDERPDQLYAVVSSNFGLEQTSFVVDRGAAAVDPVAVQALLADGKLSLSGQVPDEQSISELNAAGVAVWGTGNVDTNGLSVADSTWTEGSVTVTGTAAVGDTRVEQFPSEVQRRFGGLVAVDITGVGTDLGPESLAAIETELAQQVLAQPIQFLPTSSEIVAESEAILATVAETLNTIPEIQVEVVGHTDNAGSATENQVLSEQRAEAVITRLAELGVDVSRLSARGEGESIPLVSNDTPEGREQNRRIEFRIVGAG
jgi:outer membrane protein OmpA-like peptidoglycan-associated protein